MHRARLGLSRDQSLKFGAEFDAHPEIHFVAVPSCMIDVNGDFYRLLGDWCPLPPGPGLAVVPIHEGQWQNLPALFPNITKLPQIRFAKAQTSVRTSPPCPSICCLCVYLPLLRLNLLLLLSLLGSLACVVAVENGAP